MSVEKTDFPLVLVTAPIPQAALDAVRAACRVRQWTEGPAMPRAALLEQAQGVAGI